MCLRMWGIPILGWMYWGYQAGGITHENFMMVKPLKFLEKEKEKG